MLSGLFFRNDKCVCVCVCVCVSEVLRLSRHATRPSQGQQSPAAGPRQFMSVNDWVFNVC